MQGVDCEFLQMIVMSQYHAAHYHINCGITSRQKIGQRVVYYVVYTHKSERCTIKHQRGTHTKS